MTAVTRAYQEQKTQCTSTIPSYSFETVFDSESSDGRADQEQSSPDSTSSPEHRPSSASAPPDLPIDQNYHSLQDGRPLARPGPRIGRGGSLSGPRARTRDRTAHRRRLGRPWVSRSRRRPRRRRDDTVALRVRVQRVLRDPISGGDR